MRSDIRKILIKDPIYFLGLILIAIGLPLWPLLVSLSQFLLMGNWLLQGIMFKKFPVYFQRLCNKKGVILFISIFLVHIVGLIYTSDYDYAFHDIKIKLPLLFLPLVIGTSELLEYKKIKIILHFFILSVLISSFYNIFNLFTQSSGTEVREISTIISHIRFSLMINVAVFSIIYFISETLKKTSNQIKSGINIRLAAQSGLAGLVWSENNTIFLFIYFFIISWLIVFLFILQSITGLVILFLVGFFLIIFLALKIQNFLLRLGLMVFLLTLPLIIFSWITHEIHKFYLVEKIELNQLDTITLSGNTYKHSVDDKTLENGHFIGLYLCEKELQEQWKKRSNLEFNDLDKREQNLSSTLIRYLTSKGLRKDSVGISQLSDQDIRNIENGIANYIFTRKFSIESRIYQIIWEVDMYRNKRNPSGHSVIQRLVYLQTGWAIICDNFWFGTGTGDVKTAFDQKYEEQKSQLSAQFRNRAHNQFFTFFITFGVFGFIWIMTALFLPVYMSKSNLNYFFIIFLMIALLSMLNEDTLETQAGATFFAYFYSLFLFSDTEENKLHKEINEI